MDRENVVYVYKEILFSYEKEGIPFAKIWMDFEGITLSEINTENDKY